MKVYIEPTDRSILIRPTLDAASLQDVVAEVFTKVAEQGDEALSAFTTKFDKVVVDQMKVSPEEIDLAASLLTEELKSAIKAAAKNIRTFHESQIEEVIKVETMPGVKCWRKSVGIEKVGLYIPGGTAPLFSTVLMLGIPAKIAGCENIILCSPPNKEGKLHPAILYAGQIAGVNQFYKVGGSQAIAAMALGTEIIPKVYKIFGPGNQYVTEAKRYAQSMGTAIDMPAGPSEVMVVADESSKANFVAADLLSQTEHGIDSQVILLANNEEIVYEVKQEIENQLSLLPRKEIAEQALEHSKAIVITDKKELIIWINSYAPEHLILAVDDEDNYIPSIKNAGSVFIGHYTPESVGDYASGTNHTLPTNGYATAYSGVSLDSFIKKITFQKLTKTGIRNIGPIVEELATAEELQAHKYAVSVRLAELDNTN